MARSSENGFDVVGGASVLGALACWSVGPLFIRYLVGHLDAWSQNFWRYACALLFLAPYFLWSYRRGRVRRDLWWRALGPSLANVVMQSFWAWSFYYLEPGFGSLVARTALVFTTILSMYCFPQERGLLVSKRFWAGVVLCLVGVVGVIVGKEGFEVRVHMVGTALMLGATVFWALYAVGARKVFAGVDGRVGYALVSLYTVPCLGVIALIAGRPGAIGGLSVGPMACVVVSGVVSMAMAHSFFYGAMQRLGPTITSLVLSLAPFGCAVLSGILFSERLSGWQWTGGAVLLAGSGLALWAQKYVRER